ncbi:MAG: hypothetical protein IJP03_02440 [Christensenellaceae bacterium]|nr:hypothetical protein [Christensenellaceae bacterium]
MPVTDLDRKLFGSNIPMSEAEEPSYLHGRSESMDFFVELQIKREGLFSENGLSMNKHYSDEEDAIRLTDRAIEAYFESPTMKEKGIVAFPAPTNPYLIARAKGTEKTQRPYDYFGFLSAAFERAQLNTARMPGTMGDCWYAMEKALDEMKNTPRSGKIGKFLLRLLGFVIFGALFILGLSMLDNAQQAASSDSFGEVMGGIGGSLIGWGLTVLCPVPALSFFISAIVALCERTERGDAAKEARMAYREMQRYLRFRELWFERFWPEKRLPAVLIVVRKRLEDMAAKYKFLEK